MKDRSSGFGDGRGAVRLGCPRAPAPARHDPAARSRCERAARGRSSGGSSAATRTGSRSVPWSRLRGALGARIDLRLLWHGEGLDRLLDARHARLVEIVLALLDSNDWDTATEVSFNIRGERGSIDVLACHRPTRCLLIIEVKSVVPDIQAMLHGLDRKGRLAPAIAAERRWDVASVTKMLVLPEDRTARRRIATHAATIRAALPARTVAMRAWIRSPVSPGPGHGVLFLSDAPQASVRQPDAGFEHPRSLSTNPGTRRTETCQMYRTWSIWPASPADCSPEVQLAGSGPRGRIVAAGRGRRAGPWPRDRPRAADRADRPVLTRPAAPRRPREPSAARDPTSPPRRIETARSFPAGRSRCRLETPEA